MMKKKLLIFFLAILLICIILSCVKIGYADTEGLVQTSQTSGTPAATTSAADNSGTASMQQQTPQQFTVQPTNDLQPQDVSKQMNLPLKSVEISSGTVVPNFKNDINGKPTKELTGWEIQSGVDAKGNALPSPKDFKSTQSQIMVGENKFNNLQNGGKIKVDKDGNFQSIDAKAGTGGSDFEIDGKTKKVKTTIPEGSKITTPTESSTANQDHKVFDVLVSKDHSKIDKTPTIENKAKPNDKAQESMLRFHGENDAKVGLPDDTMPGKQVGFSKDSFSYDGGRGNWVVEPGKKPTLNFNGIDSVKMANRYSESNKAQGTNPRMDVFFGNNFDRAKYTKDGGGAYVNFGDKTIKTGSTDQSMVGNPIQLIGQDKNPYLNQGYLALSSLQNSEMQWDASGAKPKLSVDGYGVFDNDNRGFGIFNQDGQTKLLFKEGKAISEFSSTIGSIASSIGLKKPDAGVAMDLLPFDTSGNVLRNDPIKVSFDVGTDGKVQYQVKSFDAGEKDIGRVMYNEPPIDSKGKDVSSPVPSTNPQSGQTPSITPSTSTPSQPPNQQAPPGWDITKGILKGININTNGEQTYPGSYNKMFGTQLGAPFDPNQHKLLALDFSASWCGPCREFAPQLHAAADSMGYAKFIPVDTDSNKGLALKYGITSLPSMVIINPDTGDVVDRFGAAGQSSSSIKTRIDGLMQSLGKKP